MTESPGTSNDLFDFAVLNEEISTTEQNHHHHHNKNNSPNSPSCSTKKPTMASSSMEENSSANREPSLGESSTETVQQLHENDSKSDLCIPAVFGQNNRKISSIIDRKTSSPNRPSSPSVEKCPICLAEPTNNSATDSCRHKFCFVCLLEWSKIKPTCPLCKQPFTSIIYNIRSDDDFDKYELPPPAPEGDRPRPRFRYPTTMTTERLAILQRVRELQTRILEQNSPRRGLAFATSSWHAPSVRTLSGGIAVGGYSTSHWEDRARHALEAHRRTSQGNRDYRDLRRYRRLYLAAENATRDQVVGSPDFRRLIYERGLRVIPMERAPAEPGEPVRVRDTRPEFFRENPAMIHRLIPWLTRELGVLLNNNAHQVQSVTQQIVGLICRYDINSEQMERSLGSVLLQNTNHFLHEFYNFARSPYETVQNYDTHAFYARNNGEEPPVVNLDQEPDREQEEEEEGEVANEEREGDDVIMLDGSPPPPPMGNAFSYSLQSHVTRLQEQLERIRQMLFLRNPMENLPTGETAPEPQRYGTAVILQQIPAASTAAPLDLTVDFAARPAAEPILLPPPQPRHPPTPVEIDLTEDSPEIAVADAAPAPPPPPPPLAATAWDSDPEEPGPSTRGAPARKRNWSDSSTSSGPEPEVLCEMKPKHLRTPELVTLPDDNDEQERENGANSNQSTPVLNLDYRSRDFVETLRRKAKESAKKSLGLEKVLQKERRRERKEKEKKRERDGEKEKRRYRYRRSHHHETEKRRKREED